MNDFACRIEADSINASGQRLTTMVVTYARIVHSEMMTHRVFSRNSASSRAIPIEKMIGQVEHHPYVPALFAANQKGMQAGEPLGDQQQMVARTIWCHARLTAISSARALAELGVHKQWANRLLEPFAWITVVISATEWDGFFGLRCHPDAHPDIRRIAEMMRDARQSSSPTLVEYGGWHLPFTTEEERKTVHIDRLRKLSVGRCARVSYLTHDGKRDHEADIVLFDRLTQACPAHASPLEHVATPAAGVGLGNFQGWRQLRHVLGMR